MTHSIQYRLENAIESILSGLSGVNIYSANRIGKRLMPYITIQASINEQILGNFTGVYDINVAVSYSDTAAKTTQDQFDEKYCQIFDSFYEENPSLATKIQDDVIGARIYMARIISQSPSIRSDRDAWVRGLVINAIATPDLSVAGNRSYDFSEELNSFYIATI